MTRLVSGGFLVAVTVGGGLLSAGVAHAQAPPNLGALTFDPPVGNDESATIDASAGTTDTQTALAVTPPSPVQAGTVSTLTTTIIPATAQGSVQFKDGSNNIGSPVAVLGGIASTTTTLASGTHSLTAVFTGGPGLGNSTSLPVSYVVNGDFPGAPVTTTTLTTSPASPVGAGTKMTLNAAVGPDTAAGTVQFKAGVHNIGGPVTVSGGTASTTTTLAPGTQSLTAVFTPADPAAFGASTSPAVSFVINDDSPGLRRLTRAPR